MKTIRTIIITSILLVSVNFFATAQSGLFDMRFGPAGVTGSTTQGAYATINDAVGKDNYVIMAGNFESAGNTQARDIGVYDKSQKVWFPIVPGIGRKVGDASLEYINKMLVHKGELYVAGKFDSIGDLAAQNIAKYNFTSKQWSAVGNGIKGEIFSINVYKDSLVVGGLFDVQGLNYDNNNYDSPQKNIVKWNPTRQKWVGFGYTTVPNTPNNAVYDIVVDKDTMYIAGQFTNLDNFLAKLYDNTWHSFGTINLVGPPKTVKLTTIAIDAEKTIYVGGSFTSLNNLPNTAGFARFKNNTWEGVGDGLEEAKGATKDDVLVNDILVHNNDVYIGGRFGRPAGRKEHVEALAKWDGEKYTQVEDSTFGFVDGTQGVKSLIIYDDNLLALGAMTGLGKIGIGSYWNIKYGSKGFINFKLPDYTLEKFAGNGVEVVNTNVTPKIDMIKTAGDYIYFFGFNKIVGAGGNTAYGFARYNTISNQWDTPNVQLLNTTGAVYTLDSLGNLIVSGRIAKPGESTKDQTLKYIFDTQTWESVTNLPYSEGVADIFKIRDKYYYANLTKWLFYVSEDGENWSKLSISKIGESFSSAAPDAINNRIWYKAKSGNYNYLMYLDLEKNTANMVVDVKFSTSTIINKLMINKSGELYISGNFTSLNNNNKANYIVKWDGTTITTLGDGLPPKTSAKGARDLMLMGDSLFIIGDFGIPLDSFGNAVTAIGSPVIWSETTSTWHKFVDLPYQAGITTLDAIAPYKSGFFFSFTTSNSNIATIDNVIMQSVGSWNVAPHPQFPAINLPTEELSSGITRTYQQTTLSIYPNPASDFVRIDNLKPGSIVSVTDLTGKTIYRQIAADNQLTISVNQMSEGIYILRTQFGDSVQNGKLIVKK